ASPALGRAPGPPGRAGAGLRPPAPSLWAEPGSVIALGRPGALWCGGPWRPRSAICIGRESQSPGTERCPWSPETRPIPHTLMAEVYAGRYCCVCLSAAGWSEPSAALELGQVGARGAPSRSAQPSLVVASGGNVSLSCRSEYDDARTAHLLKEGGAGPLHSLEARFSHGAGVWQATFLLGPVDGTQGGIYRCYCAHSSQPHVWSLPSDGEHLHTLKPSLQAQQGPRCPGGVMVALRCGSEEAMDTFLLHKVGSGAPPQHLHVPGSAMAAQATFTLGPVTSAHGATYRCYGTPSTDPYLWSWRSDPLNVRHAHPVVQPGPTVTSGENVTFYCRLEKVTNTFFLLQEGGPSHAQGSHGAVPAEFPVGPVTSAHTGTYRCFGTYSAHVWSFPSEPVKLLVTGEEAPSSQVLPGGPSAPAPAAWDHTAQNLLRIGLAVLVLVALTWLLAEDWLCRWRTREGARRAQAAMDCDVWAVPQSGVTCTEWGAGVEVTAC
uniref:Ig-like domain-containing protein n=1 Tax=Oryctolagus cuniculus TaxID=9986 RepID=A0A5F9CYB1_RABIT